MAGDDLRLQSVGYPEAKRVTLGFQEEPLLVFEGKVPIRAKLVPAEGQTPVAVPLRLTIQACDDEKCLMPEDLLLELPRSKAPGTEDVEEAEDGEDVAAVSGSPKKGTSKTVAVVTLAALAAGTGGWIWWRRAPG